MKPYLRTAATLLALSLSVFGLTACTDTGDCDASGTTTTAEVATVSFVDGKGGGKPGKSKKAKKFKVHGSDNCEDDD